MREVLEEGAWNVRLIGKVSEPGTLNGLHAKGAGTFELVGAAVAYVEAFFWGHVQGLHGTAVDFRVGFEKALFVGNHCGIKKRIERRCKNHVAFVGKGICDESDFVAFFAKGLQEPERFRWDVIERSPKASRRLRQMSSTLASL